MLNNEQNIDRLILGVKSITKNRCSLSDEEVKHLDDCVELLEKLRQEIAADKQKEIFSKAVTILLKFFWDDIHNLLDQFM
ncbi:MAG: hypothetical protein K2U26_05445 [Cyclobacteriaceae bacterium]|nr:hypothetical protein [Cyclobacteriaceae bacterium]